jgi:type I restriction enzyme R subunit
MQRLARIADAVDALISPDPLRREFLGYERLVSTLYNAVKPDPAALEFAGRVACLAAIADAIRAKLNPNPADISGVMGDISKLLDSSITGVAMPAKPTAMMDLSKIDFETLRKRFKESEHKNTDLEVLKAAIGAQLEKLIRLNKTRTDFRAKFEELIDSYNAGNLNIEDLFNQLVALSRTLGEEQQRHVREHDRGRAGGFRHPDPARAGVEHGRAYRDQKSGETIIGAFRKPSFRGDISTSTQPDITKHAPQLVAFAGIRLTHYEQGLSK